MSHWNETYDALAGCYDDMTEDVNYPGWADFLEKLFSRGKHPVHTVLDLACGTGTMSFLLAARGYELIGVDFSPEMLAIAAEKTLEGEAANRRFFSANQWKSWTSMGRWMPVFVCWTV